VTVLLTISETIDGAAVSDTLEGGGSGVDLGVVTNNSYAPRISKAANTGRLDLFIRHDGAAKIADLGFFMQEFGVGTGFTYGGADTAADDFTNMKSLGNASGDSKNNANGLSGGLWIDMNANVAELNQFDFVTNGFDSVGGSKGGDDTVRKFGDSVVDGTDINNVFPMSDKAAVIASDQGNGGSAGNGFIPNAPVEGEIGPSGDIALGDNGHVKLRVYLPTALNKGGLHQFEWVSVYSFSA